MQLDDKIDTRLNVNCLGRVRVGLAPYVSAGSIKLVDRNQSPILREAFSKHILDDHILYFCCHAQADGDETGLRINNGFLALTDSENHITPGDIDYWLGQRVFQNCPIVFLNACQSGQMNSVFYQGFVPTFLNRKASAVIGAQTEIPACFAGEFAYRFFDRFFRGRSNVGQVIWELRRELLDTHHNPLGLLYSVYRGADVKLRGPVPGAA